ncbi:MAG: response regulator transcription factor [Verrucomicrobiales bacterium]|nr:response regulator transcription factor [Verrucomicrobiales bacterium]
MKQITVLLAEDHMIVREGLRKLLEAEDDLEVVGEAQTGRQAVKMTGKLRPAVVVMDIAMPLLNGLEATRQILQMIPATKVLILSAHSDDAYVEEATAAGATGFLLKQTSAHDLAKAIREVESGNTFFSPSISRHLRNQHRRSPDREELLKNRSPRLTSREQEVLQLIAEGRANKETALELGISVKTVEKHRQRLMQKLDIHDTAGLTRHAIAAGIIESRVQLTVV